MQRFREWVLIWLLIPVSIYAQTSDPVLQRIESLSAIKADAIAIDSLQKMFHQKSLTAEQRLITANKLAFRLAAASRFDEGLRFCHEQITLARISKADSAECVFTKLLGVTYYYMQQRQDALFYFEKGLKLAEQKGYYKIAYSCSSNMGGLQLDLKEYAKAEKSLQHALTLMERYGAKPEELFITKRLMATLYDYQGRRKEAAAIYESTIQSSLQNRDSLSAAHAMTFYADLLWKQQQYQKAIAVGWGAIALERKGSNKNALLASLTMQRKYLIGQQNFRELGSLDSEIIDLQKAVFSTDLNKEISETEVKYKMAELLYQQQLTALTAKKKQQLLLVTLIGAAAVTVLVFMVVSQRNRSKLREKLEAEKAAAIILGEEQERMRMAAELHDGVGQMMSVAKMKLSALEQELAGQDKEILERYQGAIGLVDTSCAEIRQIAHNLSPYWVMKLGFDEALKRLTQKAEGTNTRINLYADPLPPAADKVTTSTLFRVIQECINNALKHAKATSIDVAVNIDENGIAITVEDDGVGFNQASLGNHIGIGIENIRKRIHYLNGTVEWDSTPGKGTLVAINVPL
ncbi:MAG: hypothetical protein GXC72_01300 [Chitinophagaceae bacterium]|nr:hypothetical protein [Chitinophagaceae bacterium]